jgi:hypothetical protein
VRGASDSGRFSEGAGNNRPPVAGDSWGCRRETRSNFAATLEANVEFGGRFGIRSGIEIGAAHIKMAEPGVGKLLRFLEGVQGLTRVALFEMSNYVVFMGEIKACERRICPEAESFWLASN